MAEFDRDYIVDFEILGETILDYSRINIDIKESISEIKDSIKDLYKNGWKGEAKEAFEEKFNTWLQKIKSFNENISELEKALRVMDEQSIELDDEGGNLLTYL